MKGLNTMRNPKHMAFVLRYLETGNVEESYMKVYPSAKPASAYTLGRKILRSSEARALMETYIMDNLDEAKMLLNVRRIIDEMSDVAFGSIRNNQKVPALRALGEWAGLSDGVDGLLSRQKLELRDAVLEFKSTFSADEITMNNVTNAELEDYLEIYGIDNTDDLSKKDMIKLLKVTVKKYRQSDEYKAYNAGQASQEDKDSEAGRADNG